MIASMNGLVEYLVSAAGVSTTSPLKVELADVGEKAVPTIVKRRLPSLVAIGISSPMCFPSAASNFGPIATWVAPVGRRPVRTTGRSEPLTGSVLNASTLRPATSTTPLRTAATAASSGSAARRSSTGLAPTFGSSIERSKFTPKRAPVLVKSFKRCDEDHAPDDAGDGDHQARERRPLRSAPATAGPEREAGADRGGQEARPRGQAVARDPDLRHAVSDCPSRARRLQT